jgi:hypothetical protein
MIMTRAISSVEHETVVKAVRRLPSRPVHRGGVSFPMEQLADNLYVIMQ